MTQTQEDVITEIDRSLYPIFVRAWPENPNYLIRNDGQIFSISSNKFLSPRISNGYHAVNMKAKNGDNEYDKSIRVHILVAAMFIVNDNSELKTMVDHKNLDRLDNHFTNLRYVTPTENNMNNKTMAFNKRRVSQYTLNGNFMATFDSTSEAGRQTGSSLGSITHCAGGRCKSVTASDKRKYVWKYTDVKEITPFPVNSKKIPNYDPYYVTSCGKVYSTSINNYLKLGSNKDGYVRVGLFRNGVTSHYSVHRLVAEAFMTNKPNNYDDYQINHLNGIKHDNNVSNLQYVTASENSIHSHYELGNGIKSVNIIDRQTGDTINTFSSATETATYLGVTVGHIANICRGVSTNNFDFDLKYV